MGIAALRHGDVNHGAFGTFIMAHARIYQQLKNAMQSGRARTDSWVLEYEPAEAKRPDPLTGWAGSGDTRAQIRLSFPTLDAAQAYAAREGLTAHVVAGPEKKLKLQAYADNFMVGPITF